MEQEIFFRVEPTRDSVCLTEIASTTNSRLLDLLTVLQRVQEGLISILRTGIDMLVVLGSQTFGRNRDQKLYLKKGPPLPVIQPSTEGLQWVP